VVPSDGGAAVSMPLFIFHCVERRELMQLPQDPAAMSAVDQASAVAALAAAGAGSVHFGDLRPAHCGQGGAHGLFDPVSRKVVSR
jgi:hypothetical protein